MEVNPKTLGFITLLTIILFIAGCDTHRIHNILIQVIDETNRNSAEINMSIQTQDKGSLVARSLVEKVALEHAMQTEELACPEQTEWCIRYKYPASSLRLMAFKLMAGDKVIIELQEFGPVFETEKFRSLKRDLVKANEQKFGSSAVHIYY